MELILDTADVEAIKNLNELLNVSGVTTNPTIITKSNKPFEQVIAEIIEVLSEDQKLFIQVVANDFEGIMQEAKYIHALRDKNMYVKIPVTHDGLKAIKKCKELGIHVLATAIYTSQQGFMAALNGADYLAPYVNRMCNYGNGIQDVIDLITMLKVNHMDTKVIAASFKNTQQVHALLTAGIQSVTIPVDVAYGMIDHPATNTAVEDFNCAWKKAYNRTRLR